MKKDGSSSDDHNYFLFWARINGMGLKTAQDKAEEKVSTSQENTISIFLPDLGEELGTVVWALAKDQLMTIMVQR